MPKTTPQSCLMVLCSFFLGSWAQATTLRGTISLPPSFSPNNLKAQGYWLMPNEMLEILPPIVDPRMAMVVVLDGDPGSGSLIPPLMTMEDFRLSPPVLPVRPNTKVKFENKDPTAHLLESPGAPFMPTKELEAGASFEHANAKPGTYTIHCSEHPHMRATILALDEGQFTVPDGKGIFNFLDVAPGNHTLRIWYQGEWIHSQPLSVKGKMSVEIQLKKLPVKE
jgi:hypothetical protein